MPPTIESDPAQLLEAVVAICREAGRIVLQVYQTDFEVRGKADQSPVTEADERSEALIVGALHSLTPGVPVAAEEAVAAGQEPPAASHFWLVDPLDGTKEFIGRNGEFTINVALIQVGTPVLGLVYAPALDKLYAGATGIGACVEQGGKRAVISARRVPAEGLTVVASRSHADAVALDAFLAGRTIQAMRSVGSSLKLCLVAEGEADLYPRLGPTMECVHRRRARGTCGRRR
jgi:3'(2'), 5'-bisphosphate nucleotidase